LQDFSAARMAENIARAFQQVSLRDPASRDSEGALETADRKS